MLVHASAVQRLLNQRLHLLITGCKGAVKVYQLAVQVIYDLHFSGFFGEKYGSAAHKDLGVQGVCSGMSGRICLSMVCLPP
jgi:hypothetical protein